MAFDPNTGDWSGTSDPNNPTSDSTNFPTTAPPPVSSSYVPLQPNGPPAAPATPTGPPIPPGTPPQTIIPGPGFTATPPGVISATPGANGSATETQNWQNYTGDPTDPNAINQYIMWLSQQSGADPSLIDPTTGQASSYWAAKVLAGGGLTPGNVGYYNTRSKAGAGDSSGDTSGSATTAAPGTFPGNGTPGTPNAAGVITPNIGPVSTSSPLTDPTNAAIIQLLQTPQTINAETVAETPEMQAERLQSQRSAEQLTAQSAEQAAQSGESGTGGQEGMTRQIGEAQAGQDTAAAGQVASTLRQQQIQQLETGIQDAMTQGNTDQARQLQAQLAELQAQEQSYGISTGAGTAADQLGLGYATLNSNQNAAALHYLLYGY
jgi:hypothetical protein